MPLRNRLRELRARHGLTQEVLADRVGVRRQTVLAVEHRRYVPSTLLALRLARELDVTVDELFELDDEREG